MRLTQEVLQVLPGVQVFPVDDDDQQRRRLVLPQRRRLDTPADSGHALVRPVDGGRQDRLAVTRRRAGGQGGKRDLYVCFRKPDGSWSEAFNLGDSVNTNGITFCPSVSPDKKYIFYTANLDIYWVSSGSSSRSERSRSAGPPRLEGHGALVEPTPERPLRN